MKTDKKYTLVVSAYQHGNTPLQNMLDTQVLHYFLAHDCHVHAIPAVNVRDGEPVQAFVVHTNSSNTMVQIRRHAFDVNNQPCVLMRNNRKHDVQLHHIDTCRHIGHDFCKTTPAHNYTTLNGKDFWSIAS